MFLLLFYLILKLLTKRKIAYMDDPNIESLYRRPDYTTVNSKDRTDLIWSYESSESFSIRTFFVFI